ncbi:ABC transporter permease [Saccharicrinis sp. FJH2]|uniref:ABC transporter permease n=1 Tax=Saccharicrinis sp. FJH65 TaxID=3344659 RepID=UPI0035F4A5E2
MNLEYFIAKHIYKGNSESTRFSGPAVKVAIAGIALGLAVMIIAVAIVTGFKKEIREKVIGFGSHIRISNFDNNNSFETVPIRVDSSFVKSLYGIKGIKKVQSYATKPGIIKHGDAVQGVILKGFDKDFDHTFIDQNLISGKPVQFGSGVRNDSVMISERLAKMMHLKLGDKFNTFFFQDKIRARSFYVKGIFRTNFPEFDKLFVLVDIRHIKKLNNWDDDQVSGFEIIIDDFDHLDQIGREVFLKTANKFDDKGSSLLSRTIKELHPDIFGWLDLLDMNVWIILALMLTVASFNMISGVLILILERTSTIGLLKSLGARNWSIRKIFLYNAAFLIIKGLLWGNVIGVLLCLAQYYFQFIPLDPQSYYVDTVPINLKLWHVLALNAGSMLMIVLMMVLPSYIITRINPSKSMKFE